MGTSDSHDLRLWNVACVPRSIWGMVSAQSAAVHMMPCSRCAALLPLLLLALLLLPEPVACAASASDSADTAPGFDLWAPTYDEDAVELGWAAPEQAAAQLSPFLPDLQALRGDGQQALPLRALDAGCGSGLMEASWRQLGLRDVTGIDLSAGMLEVARRREFYSRLVHAGLDEIPLPFAVAEFDVVVCVGVLSYVRETVRKKTAARLCSLPYGACVLSLSCQIIIAVFSLRRRFKTNSRV